MNDLVILEAKTVRFWLVGGTGVNLGRSYRFDQPTNQGQLAKELFAFIDTSFSNMSGASKDDLLVINGGRGLGKDQAKGIEVFDAEIGNIMAKFEPGLLNVVVCGISGGTGSTGGRKVIEKLHADGQKVIAILISSHDSDRSTLNTIGCIMNLQKAVRRTQRPLAAYYYENQRSMSLPDNNTAPLFVMRLLSILGSGKNGHLDDSDVQNFLDYHLVLKNRKPALNLLSVYAGEEKLPKDDSSIISFAALLKSKDDVPPQVIAGYDTVGYLPEDDRKFDNSFYYTLSSSGFDPIMEKLNKDLERYTRESLADKKQVSLIDKDTTDGEVVL